MMNFIEFGNLRYGQFIGLWFSFKALLTGCLFYLCSFILMRISQENLHQISNPPSSNTSAEGNKSEKDLQTQMVSTQKKYTVKEYTSAILIWFAYLSWCAIPHILAGFNLFSVFYAFLVTFGVLNWRLSCDLKYLFPSATKSEQNSQDFAEMLSKKHPARYFGSKSFICLLSILYPVFHSEICLTFNSEVSGFKYNDIMLGDVSVSTRLSRWLLSSDSCPEGAPCYVYATLEQNSSTSFYLNIHTSFKTDSLKVKYRKVLGQLESDEVEEKNTSFVFSLDIEGRGSRRVHTILFKDLLPGTEYLMEIIYSNHIQKTIRYKTLPASVPVDGIKMIYWTDLLRTAKMKTDLTELARTPVDLIHFGGNIAYDNGIFACYQCWDDFLGSLQQIFEKWGFLVPIIVQSASFDIGSNQIAKKDQKLRFLPPLVMKFFPQGINWKTNPNETDFYETKAYFEISVGEYLLLNIDSGFIAAIEGKQSDYLKSTTEKNPEKRKIAFVYENLLDLCSSWYKSQAKSREVWQDMLFQLNFSLIFEGGKSNNKLIKHKHKNYENELLLAGYVKKNDCILNSQTNNITIWENHSYWTLILKPNAIDLSLLHMGEETNNDPSKMLSFPLLKNPLDNQENQEL